MDLYLAAAYNNEEAIRMAGDMKINEYLQATKEARRTYEGALSDLKRHKAEHGC